MTADWPSTPHGAGNGSRTRLSALGGRRLSRWTIPTCSLQRTACMPFRVRGPVLPDPHASVSAARGWQPPLFSGSNRATRLSYQPCPQPFTGLYSALGLVSPPPLAVPFLRAAARGRLRQDLRPGRCQLPHVFISHGAVPPSSGIKPFGIPPLRPDSPRRRHPKALAHGSRCVRRSASAEGWGAGQADPAPRPRHVAVNKIGVVRQGIRPPALHTLAAIKHSDHRSFLPFGFLCLYSYGKERRPGDPIPGGERSGNRTAQPAPVLTPCFQSTFRPYAYACSGRPESNRPSEVNVQTLAPDAKETVPRAPI